MKRLGRVLQVLGSLYTSNSGQVILMLSATTFPSDKFKHEEITFFRQTTTNAQKHLFFFEHVVGINFVSHTKFRAAARGLSDGPYADLGARQSISVGGIIMNNQLQLQLSLLPVIYCEAFFLNGTC